MFFFWRITVKIFEEETIKARKVKENVLNHKKLDCPQLKYAKKLMQSRGIKKFSSRIGVTYEDSFF